MMTISVNNNAISNLVPDKDPRTGSLVMRFKDAGRTGRESFPSSASRAGPPAGTRSRSPASAPSPQVAIDMSGFEEVPLGNRPGRSAGSEAGPPVTIASRADGSVAIHIGDAAEVDHITSLLAEAIPPSLRAGELGGKLAAHLDAVAARLVQMGETRQSVKATIEKGQTRDLLTAIVAGAVRSVPGMTMGLVADNTPGFFAFIDRKENPVGEAAGMLGFVGLLDHAIDSVGSFALKQRLAPREPSALFYMAPDKDKLVPAAVQALEAVKPDLLRETVNSFMTSSVPSVTRGVASLLVGNLVKIMGSPAGGALAENLASNVGRLLTGAVQELWRHKIDCRMGYAGPLWLFARQDWEQAYSQLKASPPSEPFVNAARKLAWLLYDTVKTLPDNAKNFFLPERLAEGILLISFLSAYGATRAAVGGGIRAAGGSEILGDAIGHAVGQVPRGLGIGLSSAIGHPVQEAAEKLSQAIEKGLAQILGESSRTGDAAELEGVIVEPSRPPSGGDRRDDDRPPAPSIA